MRALIMACLLSTHFNVYAGTLPDDSVYQVGGIWQTQDNQAIPLESLAGKPQVMALVFTGCSNACPIIIESMRRIERQVPINKRGQIGFVLVSLTPDTDFPKTLKAFAEKKQLNENWTLLRGSNATVRALSNALNGRYNAVKGGDVAHSNTVTLLTSQGQIAIQASGTLTGVEPIVEKIAHDFSSKAAGVK